MDIDINIYIYIHTYTAQYRGQASIEFLTCLVNYPFQFLSPACKLLG